MTTHSVSLYELGHKSMKRARSYFDKGTVALKRHNYTEGMKLLEKALAVDPNYWSAQNNLGFALLQTRQPQRAQQAFRRAIEIDPGNAIAYTNMSITALHLSDYSLAKEFAAQALKVDPTLTEAKAMLGLAIVSRGDWTPQARQLLEESKSIRTSETLLKRWPRPDSPGPSVTVLIANTQ